MSDLAIQVHGLGKCYRVSRRKRREDDTLGGHLTLAAKGLRRRLTAALGGTAAPLVDDAFWALRDVTFDVRRGEVLGIVGSNGAGKSTLLKVLSLITDPTEGEALIQGRVASLLEVGTGFHDDLSGRDNVFFSGSILGMQRREIARKFDEIVEFAGVSEFIDLPIKRYSSGMRVRLGFAVAAHLEPEILIVDEVLAVGDATFQKRCVEKMEDVAGHGRTVLVVSHNLDIVRRLTTSCLLLEQGRVALRGATEDVVLAYLDRAIAREGTPSALRDAITRPDKAVRLLAVRALRADGVQATTCTIGDAVALSVECEVLRDLADVHVVVRIVTFEGSPVLEFVSADAGHAVPAARGPFHAVVRLDRLLLYPGLYQVNVAVHDRGAPHPHAAADSALTLQVIGGSYPPIVRTLDPRCGLVYQPASWEFGLGGGGS